MSANAREAEPVDPSFSAPIPGRFRRPVPHGPLEYRQAMRRRGAIVAPALAAASGLLALVLLAGSDSMLRGAPGFLLAVLAAPGVLVFGAPLAHGAGVYLGGVAVSMATWAFFGVLAARRATRRPAATWVDFWRELAWLAGAMWLGLVVALVAVNLTLGRAMF